MLVWALKYRSRGLSVIPLKVKGKEPLIKWQEFQNRIASEEEIKKWWRAAPNANIGIVTGAISNIVVIDLDGPEGLKAAVEKDLTSSVISFTGRGKHLWFQNPSTTSISNSVRSFPGIDIRGTGGFVVAPPSIHETGLRYHWLNPVINVKTLPEFPVKLFATTVTGNVDVKQESWVAKALREMTNGNIDTTLFTVCSRLRADGYSADDARILLQPHADMVNATPGHLDQKIKNVWGRYEPRTQTGRLPSIPTDREAITIHSPTNPDSLKQFSERTMDTFGDSGTLKTGYSKLDTLFRGGLKSSRLLVVAARTGVGKTNWLLGVIRTLCESGRRVLLFSTEMPYTQIWERYIATLERSEEFNRHQLFVCDSFAPNLEKVEEAINEIKPDVFMFDHINHVAEDPRELGNFMQGLNFIRRKYDCAGIVTAQLNRSADWIDLKTGEKITPRMSMIKGSGTIEQASSRVLLLSETRVTPDGTEIIGNLDKNDNGSKGLVHFMLMTKPYKMIEV